MKMNDSNTNTIKWINSLRGFCALLVYISHISAPIDKNLLFVFGRIGVVGFFLITGYLTTKTRENRNKKQYAINRFIRMYPTFWILLSIFCLINIESVSLKGYLANLSLFNEFVGEECIIGSSWMMPIQVVYFGIICLWWNFIKKIEREKFISISVLLFSIASIFLGLLRFLLKINFPTAFFLLIGMAFIGIRLQNNGIRHCVCDLIIYEVALVGSAMLSYEKMAVYYILAYDLGFIFFCLFMYTRVNLWMFTKLGDVGFTFFIGTAITNSVIGLLFDVSSLNVFVKLFIQFGAALIFAIFSHYAIEKPILLLGKNLEKRMR